MLSIGCKGKNMILNVLATINLEIAAVVRRRGKVIFPLAMIFLWLLMSGNTTSPDRYTYIYTYNRFTHIDMNGSMEIGYQLFMYMAKKMGLNFQGFLAIYFAIALLIFYAAIKSLAKNNLLVLGLYILYPMILDSDQIRSFMGACIVLLGLTYIIKEKAYSVWIYGGLCICAGLFQQSCFIYLIYMFVLFSEQLIRNIAIVVICFLAFGRKYIVWLTSKFTVFNLARVMGYLNNSEAKENWIIYAVFYVFIILFSNYVSRKYINEQDNGVNYDKFFRKINWLSLSFVFLLTLSPHFERLLRPVLILDYIELTNRINRKIKSWHELYIISILLFITIARFTIYCIGAGYDSYIIPIFENGFNMCGWIDL